MPRIHLDTDIGGDIDDICALALVLNWPGAELVGVTTVGDDRGRRAGYAREALDIAGYPGVPVAAGADVSLGCFRSELGLPDEARYWPNPVEPAPGPLARALDLIEASIAAGAVIVAIGPFTNFALLERRQPGILRQANLVTMGGFVHPPRRGFPEWGREMDWNAWVDTLSAATVFQNSEPTIVSLAVTVETYLRRSHLPALAAGGPLARLIARQAEAFAQDEKMEQRFGAVYDGLPADMVNFQHDPLACAIALGWEEGVSIEPVRLKHEVQDGLLHQRVDPGGIPARLVTGVDGPAFSEHWARLAVRR